MSRRKQAKPRSLKREFETFAEESTEDFVCSESTDSVKDVDTTVEGKEDNSEIESTPCGYPLSTVTPNMVAMEIDNSLESGLNGGIGTPSSWRSTDTPDDQSLSPTSCTTLSDPDAELTYTIGITENTPYACHFCDKAFPRLSYLKRHEQVHSEHMPFKCDFCQRLFKHKRSRDRHVKLHTGDRKYRCSQCEAAFSRSDHLKIHMKTHDNAKPYQCAVCNRGYNTAAALTSHMQNHKKENSPSSPFQTFRCLQCTAAFATPKDLQMHVVTHDSSSSGSDRSLHCSFCSEIFFNIDVHKQHVEQHHSPESQGKCSQCNETFASVETLALHKKCHEESRFPCRLCTQNEFASQEALEQHVRESHAEDAIKTDESSFGCEYCTMKFTNVPELQKHTLSAHGEPKTFLCSQCGAALPDFESFRGHLRGHLEGRTGAFSCLECEGEFATQELLDAHAASAHYLSTATEYGCSSCLKSFPKPDQLQRHLMEVHAHQLHQCALCKEVFDSRVDIQVHFAVKHSDECRLLRCTACHAAFRSDPEFRMHVKGAHLASFRCLLCEARLPTETQLQEHLRDRHRERPPFACALCPEAFHVEFLLERHLQDQHADAPRDLRRESPKRSSGRPKLSLTCAYCGETCKSRTELETHTKAHTAGPSRHKCNVCDEVCPSAATLAEHKLAHCRASAAGACVTCRASLSHEEHFVAHLQQHHPEGLPAPCVVCRQTLASEVEVQVHARFHVNGGGGAGCCVCGVRAPPERLIVTGTQDSHSYMCEECFHAGGLRCAECRLKFESAAELSRHAREAHRKTYQCIKCQSSFESEAEIQAHVAGHVLQEGTHHGCHLCPKAFDSPARLQCHLIEHSFEGCSAYACYLCSAVFAAPHLIQQHMLEHGLDARPYDCGLCRQKFFFRAELDCHRAAAHRLRCPLCAESFETPAEAQQHHFRAHAGEEERRRFPCPECEETFPCLSNLQGHLRAHGGAKHACPECGKEFALARNLTLHLRSHSGLKPYECPVCQKRFARKENRRAHLRSHSGRRPFICPHCGKTFSRKGHVREHMRVHVTSTTHPCETCSQSFPSTALLRQHLSEVHGKPMDKEQDSSEASSSSQSSPKEEEELETSSSPLEESDASPETIVDGEAKSS